MPTKFYLTQDSSYCTENAQLTKALPNEMQIVCGEYSLIEQPEKFSVENEVVLEILEIVNHEDYDPGKPGEERKGPYNGSDIAVYKVNAEKLKLKKKELYPACLPKSPDLVSLEQGKSTGIFAGWIDPEPIYRILEEESFQDYIESYLVPRQTQMEMVECKDPAWMGSSTYYPPGTICFRDPSMASCSLFGNSGSSVMRQFDTINETARYSYTGPLSMSKGKHQNHNPTQFNSTFGHV